MKRIMLFLGMIVVILIGPMDAGASQIIGTPLYRDPGVDARIRSAPLPRGYRFGRALPPSIDLEVKWRPIGDQNFNRSIRGIFIDPNGAIRVVDIHPQIMRGMRVWLSKDGGKNWRIEKWIADAWRDRNALLGSKAARILFNESHYRSRQFKDWPIEAETLIKTEFRGLYEQRAHMSSAIRFFLSRCPNNPKKLAFITRSAGPPHSHVRIFISLNGGKRWLEVNSPRSALKDGNTLTPILVDRASIAIKSIGDSIVLYTGQMGSGKNMVQRATIKPTELEGLLVKK